MGMFERPTGTWERYKPEAGIEKLYYDITHKGDLRMSMTTSDDDVIIDKADIAEFISRLAKLAGIKEHESVGVPGSSELFDVLEHKPAKDGE